FNGSDGSVYEICDTLGACDTASVSITVDQMADPPVANNDSASTSEDTPVTISVASNDTDPDGNLDPTSANTACQTCVDPANGSLGNNGDGTFTYTPNTGFTGPDSFVYEICDTEPLCDTATVSITVNLNNDPPVAVDDSANTPEDTGMTIDVASNDSDPDGNLDPTSANTACATCSASSNGSLINNNDGTFGYIPNPNFNGSDSFVYEICDTLGACDTASVSITIDPVADPPLANDDSASTSEYTPVTINVATNDTDP
ncbi:MAG: tandem-95 repeat protein, partial [Ketobacter sp.]|nr:tandem-95 repeat protein [Ketobacter sp.]